MADELAAQVGDVLVNVAIHRASPRRDLSRLVVPQVVRSVTSHGKKLLVVLQDQAIIFAPLMTGRIMYQPSTTKTTIVLTLTFQSGVVWYVEDSRTFSQLSVVSVGELTKYLSGVVGPDWLADESPTVPEPIHRPPPVSWDYFRTTCAKRRAPIGNLLVDQKCWSGIGNYLRAEILYQARTDPHRPAKSIPEEELRTIYEAAQQIIREAHRCRGLTISQYRTPTGKTGFFPPAVYGRTTDPEGYPVRNEKLGSQTIHWVPDRQQ